MRIDVIKWQAVDADLPSAETAVTSTYRTRDVDVTVLLSGLPDSEHNAWALTVFDYACAMTDGDVELLDEADNIVRARHPAAA